MWNRSLHIVGLLLGLCSVGALTVLGVLVAVRQAATPIVCGWFLPSSWDSCSVDSGFCWRRLEGPALYHVDRP
jgi:hypothetical protein